MDSLYRFHPTEVPGRCPVCDESLATRGEPRTLALMVGPAGKSVESRCFMRLCQCGLVMAVQPVAEGCNYTFRCRTCECFTPKMGRFGLCLCCVLEHRVGVPKAAALIDTLKESDMCMGRSRSDFLDGLLKGVLLGVPGLVVAEPV